MPTLTTLYSVRDALGRELWWTTSRKSAGDVAAKLNAAEFNVSEPGKSVEVFWQTNNATTRVVVTRNQFPVVMFKATKVKVTPVP